jgi:hypothetical protein
MSACSDCTNVLAIRSADGRIAQSIAQSSTKSRRGAVEDHTSPVCCGSGNGEEALKARAEHIDVETIVVRGAWRSHHENE